MPTASPSSAPTPGPWRVGFSENAAVYGGETHRVILAHPETTHGRIIADVETLPEAEANARLLAAAPQLLEQSQNLYNQIQFYLFDVADEDLPPELVAAFDAIEDVWHLADGTEREAG